LFARGSTRHEERALFIVLVLVALALVGCSGASAGATAATSEGQRAIATSIAARAAAGTTGQKTVPTAQSGPKSVASVLASAPTSPFLDGKHLVAGIGCEACHGTLPADGAPAIPSTAKCLSCHGGNQDALAAKTASLGSMNPHKAHIGKLDCDRCHGVHKSFEYACNDCHDFPIPEKYRS
jgi:hypothetical protein